MTNKPTHYERYFDINMKYTLGANNFQKSVNRTRLTVLIATRFSIVSPVIIRWLYQVSQHQSLVHLNKLVSAGLLTMVHTHRSPDNRVYVPTRAGIHYAEELMSINVHYRSQSNPSLLVNQNHIMHNLINAYILLRGVHNCNRDGKPAQLWFAFITEPEFQRLHTKSCTRTVDGVVLLADGTTAAIEVENSFKTKAARETILLKYLASLQAGQYQKIFMFSQSQRIFDDIQRLHNQLFEELPSKFNKRKQQPLLTIDDVELLRAAIIFRTKFCDDITALFYT